MPMSPYYGRHVIGFEHCYDRLLSSDYCDSMSTNYISNDTILDLRTSRNSAINQLRDFDNKMSIISKDLENKYIILYLHSIIILLYGFVF